MAILGRHLRSRRETLRRERGPEYGLRRVAEAVGVSPTWLSLVETERAESMPSEDVIVKLAEVLDENPDILLALAGRVSSRLQTIIVRRPEIFAQLIEQLDELPDHAIVRIAREVRDGDW